MNSMLVNWKTSLAGVVLIVVGLIGTLLGIHIPGFTMDAGAAITMGIGLLLAKDGGAPNVVKILVAALAISLFLPRDAVAGDIAGPSAAIAKAINSPVAPCQTATATTPLSCSGWYIGAGIGGAGGNADIIGNGINGSIFAAGITPVTNLGYQYVQGNWLFGAKGILGYDLGSNVTINGAGANANGLRALILFEVGGNASALLGNQTPITIPPLLANSILAPYATVGTQWHQLAGTLVNGIASGAGAKFDISPRSFLDLEYVYTNYNGARSGALTLNNENLLLLTYNYKLN